MHARSAKDTSLSLETDPVTGLSEEEARQRLIRYGPNQLRKRKQESFLEVFFEEIREPMILLLLATGVLYAVWGETGDAVTIFSVIIVLVLVEVSNEYRAEKAIESLHSLAEPAEPVRRADRTAELPVAEIVPGDLLVLRPGRRVAADARLAEAYGITADESALTGESMPVEKDAETVLPAGTPVAERRNMVYAGTLITRGRGTAIVYQTGERTELGRAAHLAAQAKEPRTPLQQTMRELTHWMVLVAFGFSVLIPLLGYFLSGQPLKQMVLTGLSLAFATIPEELPIIITMVLALGGYRLSRRNAIVKRLRAIETLGAITVIATDKTGTLTENKLKVQEIVPEANRTAILQSAVLCSADGSDPLDAAVLPLVPDAAKLQQTYPPVIEFSFDRNRKRMSVVRKAGQEFRVIARGSPESILSCCRAGDSAQPDRLASGGLRVLAFAEKRMPVCPTQAEAETNLELAGFIAFVDPPRTEARDAIEACKRAGIRPILITGDHPQTAKAVAEQVGIEASSIYARATPEKKYQLVQSLMESGEIVAVTGDGINDAPALAAAHIGVAMGRNGTDVAREAADIVLADDNFATIVHAIEEGRLLYENLRKGVRYYLACKVALVFIMLLPVLLRMPVPFAPIQIILMELFMDLAAAAAFVQEPAESDLMKLRPRDARRRFLDAAMIRSIFAAATGLFAAVSASYLLTHSQTVAFYTWMLGHVLLAFHLRSEREPLLRTGLFHNKVMNVWSAGVVLFLAAIMLFPAAQSSFRIQATDWKQWLLVAVFAFGGTIWLEASKQWKNRGGRAMH